MKYKWLIQNIIREFNYWVNPNELEEQTFRKLSSDRFEADAFLTFKISAMEEHL